MAKKKKEESLEDILDRIEADFQTLRDKITDQDDFEDTEEDEDED